MSTVKFNCPHCQKSVEIAIITESASKEAYLREYFDRQPAMMTDIVSSLSVASQRHFVRTQLIDMLCDLEEVLTGKTDRYTGVPSMHKNKSTVKKLMTCISELEELLDPSWYLHPHVIELGVSSADSTEYIPVQDPDEPIGSSVPLDRKEPASKALSY
jgi:hypothetical protein